MFLPDVLAYLDAGSIEFRTKRSTLKLNRAKMRLISGFVDSYLDLNKEERVTFEAELNALPTKETEMVMQIATSWMKEGLKQGPAKAAPKDAAKALRKPAKGDTC